MTINLLIAWPTDPLTQWPTDPVTQWLRDAMTQQATKPTIQSPIKLRTPWPTNPLTPWPTVSSGSPQTLIVPAAVVPSVWWWSAVRPPTTLRCQCGWTRQNTPKLRRCDVNILSREWNKQLNVNIFESVQIVFFFPEDLPFLKDLQEK